jgi:hypothetical protein
MRWTAIILTYFLLHFPLLCAGVENTPPHDEPFSPTPIEKPIADPSIKAPAQVNPKPDVKEKVVDKKTWVDHMQKALPGALCKEDVYFVKCFQTTPEKCTEFTKLLVEACLNNVTLSLPQEINSSQSDYWGQMIGRCSYDLYEKFMQSKKQDLPNCHDTDKKEDLPKPSQTVP